MLQVLGGFGVKSRPSEGGEKRGRTRSKAGKPSGVCGVRKSYEKQRRWHDQGSEWSAEDWTGLDSPVESQV